MIRLQEQLANDRACVSSSMIEIKDRLTAIEHGLNGNSRPGIKTRLDRLEQEQIRRDRFLWLVAGIATTSFLTRLFALL